MIMNYFFTPVGPEYKRKFARNVGIGLVILFTFFGFWYLSVEFSSEPEPNPFNVGLEFGKTFEHEELEIKFYDVEDSRCPLDVTCVWEGNVTVMIHVSNQTHDISGPIPIGFTITYITPYEITLKDIQPHPISTEKPDYVVTLEITNLSKSKIGN